MPHLYIDDLFSNPNSKITIIGPVDLEAFIVEDTFRISLTANYESKYDRQLEQFLGNIPGLGGVADVAKNFFGTQLKSLESTRLGWVDSEKPVFNVNIVIPAIRQSQEMDPLHMTKNLGGSLLPKSNDNITIKPPNDFIMQDRTVGRYTIIIGRWFRAPFQVLTAGEFELAKETTPRGFPIYVRGNLTFTPDRMITEDEFKQYYLL